MWCCTCSLRTPPSQPLPGSVCSSRAFSRWCGWRRRGVAKLIWRLRNRLIIAYLFIAVVPIVLIAALAGVAIYGLTGQMASYLVTSELNRRIRGLRGPAEALTRAPAANREELVRRFSPLLQRQFPDIQVVIHDGTVVRYPANTPIPIPPPEWKDASGLILLESHLYVWMHVASNDADVTVLAPLHRDFLASLVPNLGDVTLLNLSDTETTPQSSQSRLVYGDRGVRLDQLESAHGDRLPPKYNRFDIQVIGGDFVPISYWDRPGKSDRKFMVVHTRTSAVLNVLSDRTSRFGGDLWLLFVVIATVFLVVELAAMVIGVSITRTITGAVHELYEGTQRVMQGDFSHRIRVKGNDQLAELSNSFNSMTANLQQLIGVAKEKERLQSELEIAREVQSQLFPKNIPGLRTLQVYGVCNPARMVSGDYYDFMCIQDSSLAFAIGDVAGKGISAALLMAAIQSTMRTQLTTNINAAVTAGSGNGASHFSTAELVSRLNKQLYANTSPEKYATFCFGLYDDHTNTLTYTNAGHLPPILVRKGQASELEVTGTVVGAFPFSRYEEKQLRLDDGDLLVAYTDGITEPENVYGEMFGEQRLTDLLVKYAHQESTEIVARVMEAVQEWTGAGELQDDMTLLVARRK